MAAIVQKRIAKLKHKMTKAIDDFKLLQQTYTWLAGKVNRGRAFLARQKKKTYRIPLKEQEVKKITGVEEKMVRVLNLVGVEIQ